MIHSNYSDHADPLIQNCYLLEDEVYASVFNLNSSYLSLRDL